LPTDVLLLRWDTKPAAHQEDVPTPGIDTQNDFLRRTTFYAALRAGRATLPLTAQGDSSSSAPVM